MTEVESKKMEEGVGDVENFFYRLGSTYRSCVDGGAASHVATKITVLEYLRLFPDCRATPEQITNIISDGRN